MAKGFPIIFSEIDKAKSQKEKKELLLKYKSAPLMEILKYTFHPEIKFLLPPGDPPYKTVVDDSDNPTYLYGLLRKLYLFVEGGIKSHPLLFALIYYSLQSSFLL